ncbi:MAG TPA: YgiQ family radical SAM protein [Methanofastidiosum sp.]|nr:YgiQ family radical SAM protein [Methanofastidiosum sp.]HPX23969.1 YgiQ family radical SAM protein [Methanofastidiosum sp.]HQC25007.1 YgiQ family radical SAM protein [Methanofastidiosum sp.]
MIAKKGKNFDIILITAEYHDDHPLSPSGIISRVLESKGYKIGIIEKPVTKEDYLKLGTPKLFFGVTSGSIDSMLHNYTPLKKKRSKDPYSNISLMPDRTLIVYCNKIREYFKSALIVIGGIEASMRRFAHYDYWDNNVRRSIIFDTRANILVYGNGEKQILEIAERIKKGLGIKGILGTCIVSKNIDDKFILLPSFKEVKEDSSKFCAMQRMLSNEKNLAQFYDNNYLLQYHYPEYTTEDLDWIYSLPYSRKLRPNSFLKMAKFSVVSHRGCIGNCNFCSLKLHQGEKIISRSENSILKEIESLVSHPDFKGHIDDLGGPSANMYGMDCDDKCNRECITCNKLNLSHKRLISLLKKAREIQGVKKIFIRSGIRYDIAMESKEYIQEISEYHISGCLKIAPEHFSEKVLTYMNKENSKFDEFVSFFNIINKNKKQFLKYYLMICHPGEDEIEIKKLKEKISKLSNIESFQLFTPTPMTNSTCMYWTEMDPKNMKKIKVIHDYKTKKRMKRIILEALSKNN